MLPRRSYGTILSSCNWDRHISGHIYLWQDDWREKHPNKCIGTINDVSKGPDHAIGLSRHYT